MPIKYWSWLPYHDHARLVLLLVCKNQVGQLGEREVRRHKNGVERRWRPAAQVSQGGAQLVKVHLEKTTKVKLKVDMHLKEDHAGWQRVDVAKMGRCWIGSTRRSCITSLLLLLLHHRGQGGGEGKVKCVGLLSRINRQGIILCGKVHA